MAKRLNTKKSNTNFDKIKAVMNKTNELVKKAQPPITDSESEPVKKTPKPKKIAKKKQITKGLLSVTVDLELIELLKNIKENEGLSKSWITEKALYAYLKETKRLKK